MEHVGDPQHATPRIDAKEEITPIVLSCGVRVGGDEGVIGCSHPIRIECGGPADEIALWTEAAISGESGDV